MVEDFAGGLEVYVRAAGGGLLACGEGTLQVGLLVLTSPRSWSPKAPLPNANQVESLAPMLRPHRRGVQARARGLREPHVCRRSVCRNLVVWRRAT